MPDKLQKPIQTLINNGAIGEPPSKKMESVQRTLSGKRKFVMALEKKKMKKMHKENTDK